MKLERQYKLPIFSRAASMKSKCHGAELDMLLGSATPDESTSIISCRNINTSKQVCAYDYNGLFYW